MFLPQLPYPPHSGGRIVTAPLVEGLSGRHEVHLFSLTHGFQGEEAGREEIAKSVASVHTVPGARRLDSRAMASAAVSRDPYKVHRFFRRDLLQVAQEVAATHPPDAIHCQNFYTARYAQAMKAPRKVLYEENFEALLLDRWREAAHPLLKPLIGLERNRTLRFEIDSTLWFDDIATISKRDEEGLRAAAAIRPEVSAHLERRLRTVLPSLRLRDYDPALFDSVESPYPSNRRKNLVFAGSFNYLANIEGAHWFVREVLPFLPQHFSIWLVGQHPDEKVRSLHSPPRVQVTGVVPSVQPFFLHADASVVPLRIGGGVRLKILESLALGCPLVSTSVGCEGLHDSENPPRWEIADDPQDFARAVMAACRERPPREVLRDWVLERFSPERFVREMEALYRGSPEE